MLQTNFLGKIYAHIFVTTKATIKMGLKDIRIQRGLTQKQISIKMAMEQTTYSRKENGKSPITKEEYQKLSDILETSIEEIKKKNPKCCY